MARVHTHYDNLKVARDAPPEVIRAAYKTLSQKHHPDRNGNSKEAIRIIQLINSAYEVLSDPAKRQEHNDWIARTERETRQDTVHQAANPASPERTPHRASRHASGRSHEIHHSRRRSSPLARLVHNASTLWDRLCRKLARKVFRKV